jgi:hypothetical protein
MNRRVLQMKLEFREVKQSVEDHPVMNNKG